MGFVSMKIFGERNTGTNLLKELIERNSATRCLPAIEAELDPLAFRRATRYRFTNIFRLSNRKRNRLQDRIFDNRTPLEAWKHSATFFEDASAFEGVFVVFAVRHPASWLVALYTRQYHRLGRRPTTLERFLNYPWETVRRERLDSRVFRPLELYNEKIRSYLDFSGQLSAANSDHCFIKFEDLVRSQEEVYRSLVPALINPRSDFEEITRSTKDKSKTVQDYREYYAKSAWKKALSGLESIVNEQVEWSQVHKFGYEPL